MSVCGTENKTRGCGCPCVRCEDWRRSPRSRPVASRFANARSSRRRETTHHVHEDVGDDLVGEPVHGAELDWRERQRLDELGVHDDVPARHVPRRLSVRRAAAGVRPSRRRPGAGQTTQEARGAHGFWFETRRPTSGNRPAPARMTLTRTRTCFLFCRMLASEIARQKPRCLKIQQQTREIAPHPRARWADAGRGHLSR